MATPAIELHRVLALLGILGASLLAWAGAQFGSLPSRVTTVEAQIISGEKRLDRMENKIDMILKAVK